MLIQTFLLLLKDKYPNFSIYSLPSLISGGKDKSKVTLELGFKVAWEAFNSMGVDDIVNGAKKELKEEIERLGGKVIEESQQKRWSINNGLPFASVLEWFL